MQPLPIHVLTKSAQNEPHTPSSSFHPLKSCWCHPLSKPDWGPEHRNSLLSTLKSSSCVDTRMRKRGEIYLDRLRVNVCYMSRHMRYFNKTIRDRKWRVNNDWGSKMRRCCWLNMRCPRRLMSLNTGPQIRTLSWEVIVGSKRWILEGYNPDLLLGLSVFFTLTCCDQLPHTSITDTSKPQCHVFPVMMDSSIWSLSSQVASTWYLFWHSKKSIQYKGHLSPRKKTEDVLLKSSCLYSDSQHPWYWESSWTKTKKKDPKWLEHLAACKGCWASECNDSMPSRF